MESPPVRGRSDGDADSGSPPLPYDTLPHDNRTYAQREYWEERFAHEASYEWLTGFDGLKDVLTPHMRTDDRILVIGCGSSGPLVRCSPLLPFLLRCLPLLTSLTLSCSIG